MAQAQQIEYAGFLRRLGASLIDTLILFILLTPLAWFLSGGAYFPDIDPGGDGLTQLSLSGFDWRYLVINDLLPMVLVIFFWVRFGATPGKQLMECQVVNAATLGKPRTGQSLLRYLGYFLSLLPLGLGFFWIIWDKQKRGFHDMLANTRVIRSDPGATSLAEVPLERLMKEVK
ncbi:MAG: RDD family protein [Pseudomonadota bacterium]